MTDKEKQLLLKDLCARLSFDVMGSEIYDNKVWGMPELLISIDMETGRVSCSDSLPYSVERFRPYLRPMSSMTEEEVKELLKIDNKRGIFSSRHLTWHLDGEVIDSLNKKMLDWRGPIPMNLALEAPEGMYNIK